MSKTKRIVTKCKNKSKYDYIILQRSLGKSYSEIGNLFNPKISRQAVHQVVKNYERRWGTKKADA
jgi:predicted DNA-binding protein YlxM (UPF0122 family)